VDRTAVLLDGELKQMFAWSEKRQPWRRLLTDGNPADLLEIKKVVSDDYDLDNIRERVLTPDELRELRDRFALIAQQYADAPEGKKYSVPRPVKDTSQLAVWICLGTLSRIGETLMAEWSHVDFQKKTWFIPRENEVDPIIKTDLTVV
jgi:integrase